MTPGGASLVLDVEAIADELVAAVADARLDRVALAIARLGERAVDDAGPLAAEPVDPAE